MQPNTNRPPGRAGEPDAADSTRGAFEPGESFVNEPGVQGGAGELPSWLRNFADATGESPGAGKPAQPSTSHGQPVSSSEDEPSTPIAAQPGSNDDPDDRFGQSPAGDSSFFSEDDLPEWLRALSTDTTTAASVTPAAAISTTSNSPNATLQVPQISRAWVTVHDQPVVSPGANLLSSLVHVLDSRPDAVDVAPAATSTPNTGATVLVSPAGSKSAAKPKQPATAVASSGPANEARRWNRTRLLAAMVIAILVLLVIFLLAGN